MVTIHSSKPSPVPEAVSVPACCGRFVLRRLRRAADGRRSRVYPDVGAARPYRVLVTFVIAQITGDDGDLALIADTKVTVANDERATRQSYPRPCLKVVILDDDLAAGFAGDAPATALRHLVGLRGRSIDEVLDDLVEYTADVSAIHGASKSFVIAKRAPDPQLWTVCNGDAEDRTTIGTAWVGDRDAHRAYTRRYMEWPPDSAEIDRFQSSVTAVIDSGEVPTVGGYAVCAAGTASSPFRFIVDFGFTGPWSSELSVTEDDGGATSLWRTVPPCGDTTEHIRVSVPGEGSTFGALAHYVPECDVALLHPHEDPYSEPIELCVRSIHELLDTAATQHGQRLQMPTDYMTSDGDGLLLSAGGDTCADSDL